MPLRQRSYFQDNNAHPHDNAGQAVLLEELAESVTILNDNNRETLSGDKTLTEDDATFQNLDPAGARTVTLPAEKAGLKFVIGNRADAAEDITLEDDSNSTLATINQDDVAYCVSDGSGWIVLVGAGGVT